MLTEKFFDAEFLTAMLSKWRVRINLTLHHIKLVVDLRQTFFRFYQNKSVHTVRDMLGNHRGRTVVDVKTRKAI